MIVRFVLCVALFFAIALPHPSAAEGPFVKHYPTHTIPQNANADVGVLIPYAYANAAQSPQRGMPLILVHGIGGEQEELFYWKPFLDFMETHPQYQKHFSLYLFRYDSSLPVPQLSQHFRQTLQEFAQANGGKKMRVLAYSKGGLLARDALLDPALSPHIDKVITVATPFHGTPLANPEWLRQQMRESSPISPLRMTNRVFYRIARKQFPSFEEDFRWDNFDGALLVEENMEAKAPNLPAAQDVPVLNKKLITYGSYFGVGIDPKKQLTQTLEVEHPLPKERHRFRNPFSVHFFFLMVRNNLSKMPLAYGTQAKIQEPNTTHAVRFGTNPDHLEGRVQMEVRLPEMDAPEADRIPLMAYNDGISPIASSLWLGRHAENLVQAPHAGEALWETLQSLKGTEKARLFSGLNHRDWMDGSTRLSTQHLRDLLNPDEAPKTAFEWFVFDLIQDLEA
jgi:pimeloyl-ACP methyl ester carboxylesterase